MDGHRIDKNAMDNKVTLHFFGYTWEEYAFQISSLKGLFVIYNGKLDSEGAIVINDILYVGYHNGILEMYDGNIISQIKNYVNEGERIFMSYAEVPDVISGKDIEMILKTKLRPKFGVIDYNAELVNDLNIICKGSCALFPKELL